MKLLGRIAIGFAVLIAALWLFGQYEKVRLSPIVTDISGDVDTYFAARESAYRDITPGVQKRVIWAKDTGLRTDWVVLYVHGFSATSEEIRPVPDRVAAALGANLVFTRLRGHGRGGDAMAEATAGAWMDDVAEALNVARRVGDQVLVISTSTGGTLVAAAAQNPSMMENVRGSVFVSPNFGVNNSAAPLLTWPAARLWLPLVAGDRRSFEPANDAQAKYWSTDYPSVAALPMAALVKTVVALPHEQVSVPALFYFSTDDQVVVPAATVDIAARWGGPSKVINPVLGSDDDPSRHVIAGDIVSPSQTGPAVDAILSWVKELP